METCFRQLWYLTGDSVAMALVDTGLAAGEREDLAKAIHGAPKPEKPRQGKPVFPDLVFKLDPHPTPPSLSSLVTPHSWSLFNRLGHKGANVRRQV